MRVILPQSVPASSSISIHLVSVTPGSLPSPSSQALWQRWQTLVSPTSGDLASAEKSDWWKWEFCHYLMNTHTYNKQQWQTRQKCINPHGKKALRLGKAWSSLPENWAVTWYTLCKAVSTTRVAVGQKKTTLILQRSLKSVNGKN